MEKLKLPRKKRAEPARGTSLVRVKDSTTAILDSVAFESGLTKVEILDKMIKFSVDNIEWVDRWP